MLTFQLAADHIRSGVTVVEVRDAHHRLVATITPGDSDHVLRLHSPQLKTVAMVDMLYPPTLLIEFQPKETP